MNRTICIVALMGCAGRKPLPASPAATYQVGTVSAVGGTTATELYTLHTERVTKRTYRLETTSATSSWEDAAGSLTFDSTEPDRGPPPLRGAYAVASVTAEVAFDDDARPSEVVDEAAWRQAAEAALVDAGVPMLTNLVDPDGLLSDAARVFPGTPGAAWVRVVRIGGVDMDRVELCDAATDRGIVTWTCTGELTVPSDSGFLVHEAESYTSLVLDERGLVSLEEGWQGTLVHASDGTARDEPFGGRRLVTRQGDVE